MGPRGNPIHTYGGQEAVITLDKLGGNQFGKLHGASRQLLADIRKKPTMEK
jgi:hypothetical protein